MAIYKLKRKNFGFISGAVKGGTLGGLLGAIPFFSNSDINKSKFLMISTLVGTAIGGLAGFISSMFKTKAVENKYKATLDEIENIKSELPIEYNALRKIQSEVISQCRKFIYTSEKTFNFYCNVLPNFLGVNVEEWIAGWARESHKDSQEKERFAPVVRLFGGKTLIVWDFINKKWVVFKEGEQQALAIKKGCFWNYFLELFQTFKNKNKEYSQQPNADQKLVDDVNTFLDLHIKLIKKYSSLKQKSFAMARLTVARGRINNLRGVRQGLQNSSKINNTSSIGNVPAAKNINVTGTTTSNVSGGTGKVADFTSFNTNTKPTTSTTTPTNTTPKLLEYKPSTTNTATTSTNTTQKLIEFKPSTTNTATTNTAPKNSPTANIKSNTPFTSTSNSGVSYSMSKPTGTTSTNTLSYNNSSTMTNNIGKPNPATTTSNTSATNSTTSTSTNTAPKSETSTPQKKGGWWKRNWGKVAGTTGLATLGGLGYGAYKTGEFMTGNAGN